MDKTRLLDTDAKLWLGDATNQPTLCAVSLCSTNGQHHAQLAFGDYWVYVNSDSWHLLDREVIEQAIKQTTSVKVVPRRAKLDSGTIESDND